ncbi:MAG: glycosyltransferase family 2 protein [Vulcanisaeta sp.]
MFINYGTIIVLIYIVIMISSFYPMIYQLLLISIKDRDTNTKPREDYTSGGKVFLIIPAKAEPLDLIEKSMGQSSSIKSRINEIVYILDGYNDELISMIKTLSNKYGVRVMHREKPRGYKGGALNYVIKRLGLGDGDYMVVLDVDSSINPETLGKLIAEINSAHAIVPRWIADNKGDSLLARGQWVGYLLFFKVLKSLNDLVGWVPILGSGSLVSIKALRVVGYWPEDVLEDVELGVRFFINGLRVKYVDDARVNVEVPVNYFGFLKQQLRWSFGTGRVMRKYFWGVLRGRQGFTVLLYLSQYFAYVLQLLSILILTAISIIGISIPLWALLLLAITIIPTLGLYLYTLLKLDMENGGDPVRDIFAINSVNLAFILALPRIAIANLMGLLGIGEFNWVPTPKGSQRWVRGRIIDLLPEIVMTLMVATAVITAILHMLWLNLLIALPYLAGYVRGLWRVLNGTL